MSGKPGSGTLVLVTLYGGNDGLNTVIPYADPAYHDARPELAYDADRVLRIDEAVGLNPALAGLHKRYTDGKLAVVRGVGYPTPDRSHFRSMDIWQTAMPERPGNTGWVGRWLDAAGADPRLAVSFEPALPPLLAGERSAGAAVPVTNRQRGGTLAPSTLAALAEPSAGEPAARARAAACFADLRAVDEMIAKVRQSSASDEPTDDGAGVRGGQYGEPPSLTDLDDGDLRFTTDFRDVYATLLERVLAADPDRVLSGWAGRLSGPLDRR